MFVVMVLAVVVLRVVNLAERLIVVVSFHTCYVASQINRLHPSFNDIYWEVNG